MKNLDIDQLEKKNSYKVPEGFFESMQENVLHNTIDSNTKIVSISTPKKQQQQWIYIAAACVILLLSLVFVFKDQPDTKDSIAVKETTTPKTETNFTENNSSEIIDHTIVNNDYSSKNATAKKENTKIQEKKNIASSQHTNTTNNLPPKANVAVESVKEQKMEQILDVLTDEEIASIASASVSDVYLDVYN